MRCAALLAIAAGVTAQTQFLTCGALGVSTPAACSSLSNLAPSGAVCQIRVNAWICSATSCVSGYAPLAGQWAGASCTSIDPNAVAAPSSVGAFCNTRPTGTESYIYCDTAAAIPGRVALTHGVACVHNTCQVICSAGRTTSQWLSTGTCVAPYRTTDSTAKCWPDLAAAPITCSLSAGSVPSAYVGCDDHQSCECSPVRRDRLPAADLADDCFDAGRRDVLASHQLQPVLASDVHANSHNSDHDDVGASCNLHPFALARSDTILWSIVDEIGRHRRGPDPVESS